MRVKLSPNELHVAAKGSGKTSFLKHPAMFAYPSVAIFGGGEGVTLRKNLKHKTVQSVRLVKINEELVKMW